MKPVSPSAQDTVTSAAVGDVVGGIAAADYRRDAELARDDRGMAGATAAIGHDRRGALHDRLPVGIGHVGDQHVARLELGSSRRVRTTRARAGADLVADRAALHQHLARVACSV